MDIRSPLLDSKIARDNIMGAGLNVPEVNQSFEAIDSLGALYDALKVAKKWSIQPKRQRYGQCCISSNSR